MWIGMHVDECAVSMHCNRYVAAVLGEIAAAKGPDAGSAVAGESDDESSRDPEQVGVAAVVAEVAVVPCAVPCGAVLCTEPFTESCAVPCDV